MGESSVGKTSILEQFSNGKFTSLYKPTIGTDFTSKDVTVGEQSVKLNLWDTAGQEQWCAQMGAAYYRGADAAIFVYDLTQPATLQAVKKWFDNFQSYCD